VQSTQGPLDLRCPHPTHLRAVFTAILMSLILTSAACTSSAPATLPAPQAPSPTVAPASNPWAGTEFIEKTYEWTYWRFEDDVWTWSVRIPTSLYEDYKSRPRPTTGDYTVYAADDGDREMLTELGVTLQGYAAELGLDAYETVHFIATFVQQLEYTADVDSTGFDDYGRYPVETLVEDGGDCEDTAILLGKLMDALGYDVVLVRLPEHMALGVREQNKFVGTYYEYEGAKYFYLETTGLAGRIGIVPEDYQGQAAYIYDFSPRPIVTHTWTGERVGSTYHLRIEAVNHGAAAVDGLTVLAGFDAGNERMWNAAESSPFSLASKATQELELTLEIPAYDHTRLLVFVVHEGFALDKSQSRWFDEPSTP
jgi:predicted transglutaminase-like cysteine proteinase